MNNGGCSAQRYDTCMGRMVFDLYDTVENRDRNVNDREDGC